MSHDTVSFIALCIGLLIFLLVVSLVSKNYSLNRIKSKTVGDGQHGTARWATLKEIGKSYAHIPFDVVHWRKGERLPQKQGVVVGSMGGGKKERQCLAVPAAVLPQRDSAAEGAGGVVAAKSRSVVRYGGRSAFLLYQDIVKQRITPPRKRCRFQGRVMRSKSV